MSQTPRFKYVGEELALFGRAVNWKAYYKRVLQPYFGKKVLEVGAGTGSTTRALCDGLQEKWVCLEPDPLLAAQIGSSDRGSALPSCCEIRSAFTAQVAETGTFDSVLYIDVLEHIERDAEEVREAVRLLKPGGSLVVLAPAHQALFSPFDKAIGHWRRYDKKTLEALIPEGMKRERLIYLDSIGFFASSVNARLLRQELPTERQIFIWDKWMIPVSRLMDPLFGHHFGKTIVGIWKKP